MQIPEDSRIKRDKIKKDLIKILKRHGFKRSFLKYPASEVYVKEDFKAKVYSKTEHDILGSPRYGIPPHDWKVAGITIDGPTKGSKIEKEVDAYFKKWGDERFKPSQISEQKKSGIEKKISVFIAFIIAGVALSLGSLTITGNAVSNLMQTTPGLLGIILFIAGLVGMFFYSKKK